MAHDVQTVASALPRADSEPMDGFTVLVDWQAVTIPYRTYHDEPVAACWAALTPTQQLIAHCWYTRDSNGFVRGRHLRSVIGSSEPWVMPFVVALIGEYVLPIVRAIHTELYADRDGSPRQRAYGRFTADNPGYVALTASRVASYWGAYSRDRQGFHHHVGVAVIDWLHWAASGPQAKPTVDPPHRRRNFAGPAGIKNRPPID